VRRCAQHPLLAEFSLCGDAFDAFASGDVDEPYVIAEPGQSINCADCCRAVAEIKKTRNRLLPRSDQLEARDLGRAAASKL
jgi:hypothetical protein